MKKAFKNLFVLGVLGALFFSVGTAFAQEQFSTMTPLLRSKLNEGSNYNNSLGWSTSTSGVNGGDTVALTVFLYNPSQQTANNVRITLTPQSTGSVSQQTFTATLTADNFAQANGSTSVSLNTPTTLTFTGIDSQGATAVALWKDLGGTNGTSDATVSYIDGSALFNGGLNIGSLAPDCPGDGGCHQGALVIHFRAGQGQQQSQCYINNFYASPSNVSYGSATTLYWNSTGCTSASISGPGISSTNQGPNGSIGTNALYNSATYTITAYGSGGSDSRTTYVTVNQQQQQSCSISAYALQNQVSYGGSTTLYWNSTGVNTVYISGLNYNNYYNQSYSGSVSTGAIYNTQTYTFTANCQNGGTQQQTVTVYANQQQTYQCNDGYDNDGDGKIDMNDPGCTSVYDNDEYNQATASVVTVDASSITQSSARLNGLLVNSGGYATNGYFQWGTTSALGTATSAISLGSVGTNFYTTIFGLSPNTTYYFRAVATNALGTFYGDIESFVTPPATVITPPTVVNTTTIVSGTGSGSNLIQLEIVPNNSNVVGITTAGVTTAPTENPIIANVCVADHVTYRVYYKNISGRTLNDAILHVELPKDVTFEGTTAGIYNASDSTITLPIGTLIKNQDGTFFITVTVLRSAVDRDLLVATATITVENPTTLARENAIAYGLVSTTQCAKNGLLGLALFSGFWPTSLIGWLILLLLVLMVVYLASRFYRDRRPVARPAPHYEDMDVPTYRPGH